MFKWSTKKELAYFTVMVLLASVSAAYAQDNSQSAGGNSTAEVIDEKAAIAELSNNRTALMESLNSAKSAQAEFESLGIEPEVITSGNTTTYRYKSEDGRILDKVVDAEGVVQSTEFTDSDGKVLTTQYVDGKPSSVTYIDLKSYLGVSVEYISETSEIVKVKDYKTGYTLTADYNPATGVYGAATLSKEPGLPPGVSWCNNTGRFEA